VPIVFITPGLAKCLTSELTLLAVAVDRLVAPITISAQHAKSIAPQLY
jgi:hypothetical protein